MKKLFGTSALVMALALPGFAQQATTMPSPFLEGIENGVRASDFIGKRVYVTEQDTSTLAVEAIAAAGTDWDDAGEISDLIISMNGDAEAVLVDFGGFLGIGEKTVAVSMSNLVMVPDSNSADDYFIVFHGNKAQLEGAPEFNPDMVFTTAPVDATMAPADGMTVKDGTAATGTADYAMVDLTTMTEADLIGARVIGPNAEDVGEVSAVAVGADGKIAGAVVDVGGFLGIGEKRVSLGSDVLSVVRNADGTVDHFRVAMTKDQLETLADFEG